jgi:hypothetical protein
MGLAVGATSYDSITFNFTSGGGSTYDFVYTYNLSTTAPATCADGTAISTSPIVINSLNSGDAVAIRICARNVEGELSSGITLVACSRLAGDYNGDGSVDSADYITWRKNVGHTGVDPADGNGDLVVDDADYNFWRAHFGNVSMCHP